MLKAVDHTGNESVNAAVVTINIGDRIASNLILTQDEDGADFPGTIVNGTVSGSPSALAADTDADPLFWASDVALLWGADAATFWPTVTYKALTYTARYSPLSDHIGATVSLALSILGDRVIDYRMVNEVVFWAAGSPEPVFWGADGDSFWAPNTVSTWAPFPGIVGPLDNDDEDIDFRVTVEPGATQGTIATMDILVDVPDLLEFFEDVAIGSGGARLPITLAYRSIDNVRSQCKTTQGPA